MFHSKANNVETSKINDGVDLTKSRRNPLSVNISVEDDGLESPKSFNLDQKEPISVGSCLTKEITAAEAPKESSEEMPKSTEKDKAKPKEEAQIVITGGTPVPSNMDFHVLLDKPECKEMKSIIDM